MKHQRGIAHTYTLKAIKQQLRQAPLLYLLSIIGVAIGVGSVLCIQIINMNALAAFSGSTQAVSGDSDLSISPRTPTLNETILPQVLGTPGVAAAWPLTRTHVAVESATNLFLEVIGFDFFSPLQLPLVMKTAAGTFEDAEVDYAAVLQAPGWVAIAPSLAEENQWTVGDSLIVTCGSRKTILHIGLLIDFQRYSPLASSKMVLMDIHQAQTLLGLHHNLDQIDVRVAAGFDRLKVGSRLQQQLGASIKVESAEEREEGVKGLLQAFRLNLTALSLISLFVGVFLVFSTTQATLVRRRQEFGLLRAIGATRQQVFSLILGEVVLLGLLGTFVGMPLGYYLATLQVERVSITLTNIYLLQEIESLTLPISLFLLAAAVGIGGTLLGAVLPALDMSRRHPRELLVRLTLHEKLEKFSGRLLTLGISLAVVSLLWFWFWGQDQKIGGFVLGFAVLVMLPLSTPWVVRTLTRNITTNTFGWRYSLKGLSSRLQTTSFAVAALAMAVSMLLGITLLIGSFRKTLETWVESTIRADIFVTAPSWQQGRHDATLSDELRQKFATHPGVEGVERLRQLHAYVGSRRILLSGLESDEPSVVHRIPLLHGEASETWRRMRHEDGIMISEPLANKEHLALGDTLVLTGPSGPLQFPIVGVCFDYSTEAGSALLDLKVLDKYFGHKQVTNMALYLESGFDSERVIDELRAELQGIPLNLRSNAQLRHDIFDVFDQTFAITRILQVMALLVAASGITLTLMVLARERVAELALYRSLGSYRRQLFGLFLGEGMGIGLLGILIGTVGGVLVALVLIYVINPAYFGWTIRPSWPWQSVLQQFVAILGAAAIASIFPALQASATPATELSCDDL